MLTCNDKITQQIKKMLNSERTVHAFLFTGGSDRSRYELGMWLAKTVLCNDDISRTKFEHGNCEDFILVEKTEGRESIVKDQILELSERLSFKPYGEKYVVLIKDSDLMNAISQNKLLKSLEEPISPAVFILLSEREDALLSTIRSRCTHFCLEEESKEVSEMIKSAALHFTDLIKAGPCYYKKKSVISFIINDKDNSRELAEDFLEYLEECLEKEFLAGNKNCAEAVHHVEMAVMYIKQLQSVQYTLKQLCLRA